MLFSCLRFVMHSVVYDYRFVDPELQSLVIPLRVVSALLVDDIDRDDGLCCFRSIGPLAERPERRRCFLNVLFFLVSHGYHRLESGWPVRHPRG